MLQSFQARTEACILSCCHRQSHTDPGRLPTGVRARQRVNMPFPCSKGFALSVLRLNGQAYPTVSHEGQIYVVMEPKDEFEVQVTRGSALDGCSSVVLANLAVDTKEPGYQMLLRPGTSARFNGWLVAGYYGPDEPLQKQRFVCGSCYSPDAEVAGSSSSSNALPKVGRLQVQLYNAKNTGQRTPTVASGGQPSTEATRAPEGKKWFTLPGLKTGAGETFQGSAFSREQHSRVGEAVVTLEVRYDSMDNLLLRKVLDPSRPDHRQLLAGARSATVRSLVATSSVAAGHKRRVEDAASAAVGPAGDVRVKRERGAGPAVGFVDMCRDEPQPLKVNGRVLQQDEVATCDLTGDDDQEVQWRVTKKEAVQL